MGVRVHMVEVRSTRDEQLWVAHLGPDILGEEFDVGTAVERLVTADRPLVEALLDQRLVCGLGTIWASELASAAGADPFARTSQVAELGAALVAIRRRMHRAVLAPRGSPRDQMRVFERTGRPCRVCGTPIRSGRVGVAPMDRPTYWCPQCQPQRA